MFWSGGKDSFIAYLLASRSIGMKPSDWLFLTFVPRQENFLCHPLGLLERQSSLLGVRHLFPIIDGTNWQQSYEWCLEYVKDKFGIKRVFTGDILFNSDIIEDYWLLKILQKLDLELTMPLAGMYAGPIFQRLTEEGIYAVVTGVASWLSCASILGSPISLQLLHSSELYTNPYVDLAGEQGEYHTTVIEARGLRFADREEFHGNIIHVNGLDIVQLHPSLLELSSPRLELPAPLDL
jgi:diphthamide synthase (EF-2-diphthine--ammonia ligase)